MYFLSYDILEGVEFVCFYVKTSGIIENMKI
jgi:hypothetical protein